MNLEENPLDVDDELIEDVEESSIPQKMTNLVQMSPKIEANVVQNLSIIENAKS